MSKIEQHGTTSADQIRMTDNMIERNAADRPEWARVLPAVATEPPTTAEPDTAPPTLAELERACVEAYALLAAARRRLTQAECAHALAIKARRP